MELEYSEEALHEDIELTTHAGQECDLVISGSMKIQIGEHTEILHAGDCVYYDSATPHGMIAVNGANCTMYAIVLSPLGAPGQEQADRKLPASPSREKDSQRRIY